METRKAQFQHPTKRIKIMYSATELLSDEVKKVAQLKGLTINAYYDSDPFNPRKEWDNLGTLVSRGRNYCDEVYPSDVDIGNDIFDTATNFFKHHKYRLIVWYGYQFTAIRMAMLPTVALHRMSVVLTVASMALSMPPKKKSVSVMV